MPKEVHTTLTTTLSCPAVASNLPHIENSITHTAPYSKNNKEKQVTLLGYLNQLVMAAHQMFVHQFLLYPHFLVVETSTIVIGTLVLYRAQRERRRKVEEEG